MIKQTILLTVSLLGLVVAPLAVRQVTPGEIHMEDAQPVHKPSAVMAPGTAQEVITINEVVISAPWAKKVQAAPKKETKPMIRCHVRDLEQGSGAVRICDSV